MISRYIVGTAVGCFILSTLGTYAAVLYPTSTPVLETPGGTFQTYFDNMYINAGSLEASPTYLTGCPAGLLLRGFGPQGELRCVSPAAATFFIPGSIAGDTLRYDGTNWIRNNLIYNNGANVGINTNAPTTTLDVNGQIRIRGGSPAAGRVLLSDATGIATWYDPLPSLSGSFWAIGGNTLTSVQSLGTVSNHDLSVITNNTEKLRILTSGNIGIGTSTPGARLEVAGQIKITGGGVGSGKFLMSDATGLATWATPTVATASETLGLSGALVGTTNYVAKYTPTGTGINNSQIYDNGANIGIGTITPGAKLDIVGGDILVNGITVGRGGGNILTNTANGYQSLYAGITGYQNTALGMSSLYGVTTGYNNTGLGYLAGSNITIGANNIALGYNTQVPTPTGSNQLNIGNWIYGVGGDIGIGTATPGAKLEVAGQIKITGGGIGSGKILVSDATGLATWANGFSGNVTATGITGGSGYAIPYFGSGGVGLFSSFAYYTGSRLGVNTTNPQYMVDIKGSGSILNAGSGLCINDTCINAWSGLNNIVRSTGTPNYIAKFDTSGTINNSQLYETGGNLYIGDIAGIIAGDATVGYITVESMGSTNSANPLLTLSENGGQECRMWINGANKMGSNCEWTAGTSGFGFLPNQVPRADTSGDSLTGGTIYNVGNNVGIGTSSPSSTLDVTGTARITGDLTVQGKIIADTLVNRSVNNISISGSLLPDTLAPLMYRDIGSSTLRWNNLYLSGQISIAGGSPGLGKILTSDATGLATWTSVFSGTTTASGITGGTQNYVSKFGIGGNGLVLSQIYDTGTGVVIGATTLGSKFEVWSGALSVVHLRSNNIGIGSSATRYQTSGSANVGIGNNALRSLTTGYSNAAFGDSALYGDTAGYFNAGIGTQALYSNSIGNWNVALGTQALWTNLDGNYNVALGGQALYNNLTNDNSIAIGYQALRASIADNNIAIGYNAGSGITSGANNIIIGTNIQAQSNTASNQLNIGNWIYGTGGNISIGRATMSSGAYQLEVADGYVNSASGYCINGTCIPNWSGIFDAINGSGNYLPKWNSAGTGLVASRISDNGTDVSISSGALQQILITPANQEQYQQVLLSSGGVLKKGLTTREKLRIFAVSDYGANNDSVAIQNLCFDTSTNAACRTSAGDNPLTNVPNFNLIDPKSYTGGIGDYFPATTTRPAMFVSNFTGTYMIVQSYTFTAASFTTSDLGCNVFPYYSLFTSSGSIPNLARYDATAPVTFTINSNLAISNVFSSTNLSLPTQKTTRVGSQFVSNVFMTPGQALLMTVGVQSCASRPDRSMSLVTNDQKKMTLSISEL